MGKTPSCYLDTRQAAAVLGLSRRTLESYRVKGGGPPFLAYCNRIHYLRRDLDVWALTARKRSTSDGGAGRGRSQAVSARDRGPGSKGGEGGGCAGAGTGADLRPRELAALLGVSRRTLARYRARGLGPAHRKVSGQVRYLRSAVEAWLAGSRRLSTSDEGGESPGDSPGSPEDDR